MVSDQAPSKELLEQLRQANAVVSGVLARIAPQQMGLPTVNDEWDVRAVINHLVLGNHWMAETLRRGAVPKPTGDAIGEREPADAYAESWPAVFAAFARPGAMERTLPMAVGEAPATMLAALHITDLLGHAWDLAQATGQSTDLAPDLYEAAIALTRRQLAGHERAALPFKEEVSIAADAPAADRLAAFLGKRVIGS